MPLFYRPGMVALALALSLGASAAAADVVAVVSARSPVTSLSKNQIADIFLGRVSLFPNGARAVPIDLMEGAPTRDEFYAKFAAKSPAQCKAYWSKIIFTGRGQPPKEVANDIELKKRLAENPNAIGYVEQNMVDDRVRVLHSPDAP